MSTPADDASRGVDDGDRVPVMSRTRLGGVWVSAIVATLLLVLLLVFILQNTGSVTVELFGFSGALPLGVSMLLSAVVGALAVAVLGAARIVQLRRTVRRVTAGRRGHR